MSSPANRTSSSRTSTSGVAKAGWSDKAVALGKAAKGSLSEARNLKNEIKVTVFNTIDKLVALVKELEQVHKKEKGSPQSPTTTTQLLQNVEIHLKAIAETNQDTESTLAAMAEYMMRNTTVVENVNSSLQTNEAKLEVLTEKITHHNENVDAALNEWREGVDAVKSIGCGFQKTAEECLNIHQGVARQVAEVSGKWDDAAKDVERAIAERCDSANTYAQALAHSPPKPPKPMHSLIISPSDDQETSSQTIEHIKETIKARHSGARIDRVRKIRDGRVVLSCADKDELRKVEAQLVSNKRLKVEQATNKRPLVVLKNLMAYNTDADIEAALCNQNKHLMEALSADEAKVEVRYRRRARNPMECHAVLRVSPKLWQRLTSAGRVYIDLQMVKIQDQSPLVQCTRCLGFGHGRKLCTEGADLCNYCGGPHLKSECAQLLEGQEPSCKNCTRAKLPINNHSAYSDNCPVRRKWDALARAAVAYS